MATSSSLSARESDGWTDGRDSAKGLLMARSIKISKTGLGMAKSLPTGKPKEVCVIIDGKAYTVNEYGQVSTQQHYLTNVLTVLLTDRELLEHGLKEQLRQALPWVRKVLDNADQRRAEQIASDWKAEGLGRTQSQVKTSEKKAKAKVLDTPKVKSRKSRKHHD
jgi:hypothetical protein